MVLASAARASASFCSNDATMARNVSNITLFSSQSVFITLPLPSLYMVSVKFKVASMRASVSVPTW